MRKENEEKLSLQSLILIMTSIDILSLSIITLMWQNILGIGKH